ncbi:MAG: class I SAM-dependent methyltransferase [Defluviitaleaceae bacterium]|nr:class I SAM-dependent methyltransferase [Defluviitaleaceae bacterium]
MEMYKNFSAVYDLFMTRDIPYDAWAAYIHNLLGKTDEPVLDLGCGTGNLTLRLAALGHDMIGVDASEDMLAVAQDKMYETDFRVLWLAQDMRKLDLYGTVSAAVCTCDALNYLLTDEDIQEVFRRVRLFLRAGGVFIFDMNTEYKYKEVMGARTFGGMEADVEYVWENEYNAAAQINEYRVSFRVGGNDPVEFDELHKQRAYNFNDVQKWLTKAGFKDVQMRDNYSDTVVKNDTVRVVFICK